MAGVRAFLIVCTLTLSGPLVRDVAASTIGDLVNAAEQAATSADLVTLNLTAAKELTEALKTLRDERVLDEDIAAFVRRYTSPNAAAVARRRQDRYRADIGESLVTIKAVANSVLVPAGKLPSDLEKLVVELQFEEQMQALNWDLEVLSKLERKLGPESAKLNGLEVLLAYGLQRLPAFGINAKDEPGPLEAVLAYVPAYFGVSDDKMRLIGVAEIGLRHYLFGERWGHSGVFGFLRPGYASYGLAWAGQSDDAMTAPWQGQSRFGAFFGWGEIKVAYLGGDNRRFLVTQQIQLIPWVF